MNFFDSPLITNIGIIFGVIFFIWRYFMVDRGIIGSYKEAAEAYGVRILALESENATLKSENTLLKSEMEEIKKKMLSLENLVTGKDMLTEIQKILLPVPAFFAPGGALEVFIKNDTLILEKLNALQGRLGKT